VNRCNLSTGTREERCAIDCYIPFCETGGTAILIRKTLQKYVSGVNISNERIIGIELRSGNQLPLHVFCVYKDVILYNETLCDIQSAFSHYCKVGTVIFPEILMHN